MEQTPSRAAATSIRLNHRVIGGQHVFTSPDMPELWVTHADLATGKSEIEPVMQAILRLKGLPAAVVLPRLVEFEAA